MFNLEVPGSVATNTAGKCPDIVLKKITFTNIGTQSEQWSLTCWSHPPSSLLSDMMVSSHTCNDTTRL